MLLDANKFILIKNIVCYNITKEVLHMIKYVKGDLFSTPAQVLVNTVNLDGVMGKGIALQFKRLYPDMFVKYQEYCEKGCLDIGKLWLYKTNHKWILNFPTKIHWRNPSKLEYIIKGLDKFIETYQEKGITSIAFPKLGCGNGGLDWNEVKKIMNEKLKNIPIDIYIYEDQFKSEKEFKNIKEMSNWLHNHPRELSSLEYQNDLLNQAKKMSINLDEIDKEKIDEFWYSLKNSEFLKEDEKVSDDFKTLYKLTSKLDYVIPCQISNGIQGNMTNAIQLRISNKEVGTCESKMSI